METVSTSWPTNRVVMGQKSLQPKTRIATAQLNEKYGMNGDGTLPAPVINEFEDRSFVNETLRTLIYLKWRTSNTLRSIRCIWDIFVCILFVAAGCENVLC